MQPLEKIKKEIGLVVQLYRSKKLLKAEKASKKLVKEHPNIGFVHNLLGLIIFEQKKFSESIKYFNEGIKAEPKNAIIYNNLGNAYKSLEIYDKAEHFYLKSIDLNDKIIEPLNNLGNLYLFLNKYDEAINCFSKAISINPKSFLTYYNLGITYKNLGDFLKSKKNLNESIKLNPFLFQAHRALSQITKYTLSDKHFASLRDIYDRSDIPEHQKTELAFALGKAYEDINDYTQSFNFYSIGNHLRRKEFNFNIKNEIIEFKNIKKYFNQNFFSCNQISGNSDSTPIFILGMPRSGTTLVEQIISSHPDVYGGDELTFLPDLVKKYFFNKNNILDFKNLSETHSNVTKKIAKEYIYSLKNLSIKSKKITDKMPINFKWIGLIKILLPKSIIIHCVRNSRDTCFSIYKNYFTNKNLNYAYNLKEITLFYNLYKDLMNYWKKVIPNFIFDIDYEELTTTPDHEIKKLISASGLDWNVNCLKYYNNKRAIRTASDTQARNKIYKTSVNSWKYYKKFLEKPFNKLN